MTHNPALDVERYPEAPWICAVIACSQPQGKPHVPDCPYAGHDSTTPPEASTP